MKHLVKQDWLDRAVEINKFHTQCLKDDENWTLEKTATSLNRSIGSISENLMLASWAKTHEKQLRRCSSMRDAISFVKMRKRELRLEE